MHQKVDAEFQKLARIFEIASTQTKATSPF
jgi:hypothetical protein